MSIDSDLQAKASITEGDRALALFTDRYSFTRLMAERIHEPPSEKILFFYGAGGNGKSLLLKYLQQNICKRLTAQQWQQVKGLPDAELAARLEGLQTGQYLDVPTVLLDFELPPLNEVQPKDRFYGLLLLRKALGEAVAGNYRLRFARYDFACIWYLHSKGKSLDEIRALFPLTEMVGLVTTLTDAFTKNPAGAIVKAFVDFGAKGWSEKLTQKFIEIGVDAQTQSHIRSLDVNRELIDELPQYFAEDLNVSMGQTTAAGTNTLDRLVFLFDTHEAFWGAQRDLPSEAYFLQDEWLRRLLRRLELAKGIVVVVAGRDVPRWAEAKVVQPGTEIPAEYLQVEEVGLLAAGDARAYFQKVGIETGELCEGLIRFASVNPQNGPDERKVHPLHLGLCADVVLAATEQGNPLVAGDFAEVPDFDEKGSQLIERLLRYVSEGLRYAIHGLSACRAFDRSIYVHLGKVLNFVADEPTFRQLIRFSFVWQARRQGTENGEEWYRVHDLMRRLDDAPEVRRAHEALAEYYQELRSLESIYHINRLDWLQGVDLWVELFDKALTLSRYESCRILLDIRQELISKTPFKLGIISDLEGQYFRDLAKHADAERKYKEAIAAYNNGLEDDPRDTAILNNKGNSFQNLADLHTDLSQHKKAQQAYCKAISIYNTISELEPGNAGAFNNKGIALKSLADLQTKLSQYPQAQENYSKSVAACDEAIRLKSDHVNALVNKGNALSMMAELQSRLSQYEKAQQNYDKSIAAHNIAFKLKPEEMDVLYSKGNSLSRLADFQAKLSKNQQAQQSYFESFKIYELALKLSPKSIKVLNNISVSLQKVADVQANDSSQQWQAQQNYEESIAACCAALELAPNDAEVLNNKGNALSKLARLQFLRSQYQLAQQNYDQLAQQNYEKSISLHNRALKIAPTYIAALKSMGESFRGLADLQFELSQYQSAQENYNNSIEAHRAAIRNAPDDKNIINGLTWAWLGLSRAQRSQSQESKSIESLKTVLQLFEQSLTIDPKNTYIRQRYEQLTQLLNKFEG